MNDTIRLLMNHRSVRKYTSEPVSREQVQAIVAAAQMASTSSNVQAYSVIHVTDPELKRSLSQLSGDQAYVLDCPVLLVWCADLHRLAFAHSLHETEEEPYTGTTENLIAATVDTALAAQNAAVAAESLGLGIVYIGGIRNNIAQVADLLRLPSHVYPVFGMCIGYPAQATMRRPRLPQDAVLHENVYRSDSLAASIALYDEETAQYMLQRTGGKRKSSWSEDMAKKLATPSRKHMKPFLEERGFGIE